jgi:Domain of unknown function (DUF5615)
VRFLLDENFPLGLIRALRSDSLAADHIITLGWRGASDKRIRERLQDAEIVFFTQDDDFLFGETVAAVVVLSRVRQSRPLKERVEVWRKACRDLAQTARVERLFELTDEGVLLPWQEAPLPR